MLIITEYRQENRDGKIYIKSDEKSICPVCSSDLKVIGSRNRKAIVKGNQQIYVIRRLQCKECKHIHHELPDILVPYKRHSLEGIEEAIEIKGNEKGSKIQQSTRWKIKEWWEHVKKQFGYIKKSLEMKYDVRIGELTRSQIVRAIVNSHSWVQTRTA
jgi:hypothetical protein